MTTNEVLARQNFITKVVLKDGDNALSKDLKIKIMAMRIEYAKVRKAFDEDVQEFVKGLTTDEFNTLQQKEDKTEAENARLKELTDQINEDYTAYVNKRGLEEVNINNEWFTKEEYDEILDVNSGNDVEINGQKLSSADFLEVLYALFVKEE